MALRVSTEDRISREDRISKGGRIGTEDIMNHMKIMMITANRDVETRDGQTGGPD